MAPRIVLVAHAATAATRRGAFPLNEAIERPGDIASVELRAEQMLSGPELRCIQTASALGWQPTVIAGLADLSAGDWTGHDLGALLATEPEMVQRWMTDPAAKAPAGESLADLVERVGSVLAGLDLPDGRTVIVTSPLVIKAAITHLLQAPLLFDIDIEPLSATVLTGHGGRWKLRALMPKGTWDSGSSDNAAV
ncbi:MAG: histidine phosphatase family protein [Nakamurella sp.]